MSDNFRIARGKNVFLTERVRLIIVLQIEKQQEMLQLKLAIKNSQILMFSRITSQEKKLIWLLF